MRAELLWMEGEDEDEFVEDEENGSENIKTGQVKIHNKKRVEPSEKN